MTYKSLQVHVDNTASCEKRLHVAVEMAIKLNAHLTGVYTRHWTHLPNYMMPVNSQRLKNIEANYKKEMDDMENAAKAMFTEVTLQHEVSAIWHCVTGDAYSALTNEAHYSDLLILGQPEPEDEINTTPDLPDHLVLTSGRPCLIVPYIGARKNLGKHPLVAWNGTRESTRALHDSLPLLMQAESVTIMLSEEDDKDDLPDTRIAKHLARHGVKVMTKKIRSEEQHISSAFLSYIADNDHDLLIMGAYGHSRLREIVLGGMTREIMQTMTVPVLMSH